MREKNNRAHTRFCNGWACALLINFFMISCTASTSKLEQALASAGANRSEMEQVLDYFKKSNDPLKLKAASYLIEHLPGQFHHTGPAMGIFKQAFGKMDSLIRIGKPVNYTMTWDSLQQWAYDSIKKEQLTKVEDIRVLTARFLIDNIERAFQARRFPWAVSVPFEEFCAYVLPYKLKDEEPLEWRSFFLKTYQPLIDSLADCSDARVVIKLVNEDLKHWFYLSKLNLPFDLSCQDLLKIRSGKCPQEVQLAAYAMRALGIPVAMESVPAWGNRNAGHDWNGWLISGKTIPFLGAEADPGEYKLEFPWPGSIQSKKPKVYRRTYTPAQRLFAPAEDPTDYPALFRTTRLEDVTALYVPTSDVTVRLNTPIEGNTPVYLAVFNSLRWEPVAFTRSNGSKANFSDLGREIVYLPVLYEENEVVPIGRPFLLTESGSARIITPHPEQQVRFSIDRKYPAGVDNRIHPGKQYELLYWQSDQWQSIGRQLATDSTLNWLAPRGALLWLRNLDEGVQERIFTIEKEEVQWW